MRFFSCAHPLLPWALASTLATTNNPAPNNAVSASLLSFFTFITSPQLVEFTQSGRGVFPAREYSGNVRTKNNRSPKLSNSCTYGHTRSDSGRRMHDFV